MRSCILRYIPPVGRSCAYASSVSRNHVLWKLTVFSREHQLRDYGRLGWKGREEGKGRKMVVRRVCMTARTGARVSRCVWTCVYPVIEINRARSLRHTVPRSHWHRETRWSSIGCLCDFRLAVDLRIAPRERRFASHSDSQRKAQGLRGDYSSYSNMSWTALYS